jgi:hypothetical protein
MSGSSIAPPPPLSPAEMQVLVSRAGLTLNPGQMADLVLAWRQVVGLLALIPRDRPLADDQAFVFRLPPPADSAKPTQAKPTQARRVAAKPATASPAAAKPAGGKHVAANPAPAKRGTAKPTPAKRGTAKPAPAKRVAAKSAPAKPGASRTRGVAPPTGKKAPRQTARRRR